MKKVNLFLSAIPFMAANVFGAEYMPGWSFSQFYQEVVTCKAAIVMPAADAYVERGVENKESKESLRSEVISMAKVFDQTAAAGCFCAVNSVAKSTPYNDYDHLGNQAAKLTVLKKYYQGPECSSHVQAVMTLLQKPESIEALRLK